MSFDSTGGTADPASMITEPVGRLASLPAPTNNFFLFEGWFTQKSGGSRIKQAGDTDIMTETG